MPSAAESAASFRLLVRLISVALILVLGAAISALQVKAPARPAKAVAAVTVQAPIAETADVTRLRPAPSLQPAARPSPGPAPAPKKVVAQRAVARPDPWARFGYDISWPQCENHGAILPPSRGSLGIIGITGGRPFTANPCLAHQWRWARTKAHPGVYLNLALPHRNTNPAAYGAETVRLAINKMRETGIKVSGVWLDVETGNHWGRNQAANHAVVLGAIAALEAAHLQPGIYTTPLNWRDITGNARIKVPLWLAVYDPRFMRRTCGGHGIGGRAADMVQAVVSEGRTEFDLNLMCTARTDFVRALG